MPKHPQETAIVAYSGGKDSTATLLWALEQYQKVIPIFCDTKAEWPETYDYLNYVEKALNLPIVRLQSKRFSYGLPEYIRKYHFWPSIIQRACTTELKKMPLKAYLKNQDGYDLLFGQRAEESFYRSKLPEREGNLLRPILRWSKKEVLAYIAEHSLKLNPVYQFVERANCCVCPMGKPSAIREYSRRYPYDFQEWVILEKASGKTWRENMSLLQAAQLEQGSLFDMQEYSECLLDGLCDFGEGVEADIHHYEGKDA